MRDSEGAGSAGNPGPPVAPDRSNSASGHATRGKSRKTNNAKKNAKRDSGTSDDGGSGSGGESGGGAVPHRPFDPENSASSTAATSGRRAFRNAIVARLVPALRAFNPELVMLSTGFDALAEDVGNSRSGPKASILPGIDLSPDDFFWVTREIQTVRERERKRERERERERERASLRLAWFDRA
jgi:hypothetical protein